MCKQLTNPAKERLALAVRGGKRRWRRNKRSIWAASSLEIIGV